MSLTVFRENELCFYLNNEKMNVNFIYQVNGFFHGAIVLFVDLTKSMVDDFADRIIIR